jgi:hypothetical protein
MFWSGPVIRTSSTASESFKDVESAIARFMQLFSDFQVDELIPVGDLPFEDTADATGCSRLENW